MDPRILTLTKTIYASSMDAKAYLHQIHPLENAFYFSSAQDGNTFSIIVHVNYLRISPDFHPNHTLCAVGRAFLREEQLLKLINHGAYEVLIESSSPFHIGLYIRVHEQPEFTNQNRPWRLLTVHSCSTLCIQQLRNTGTAV